MNMQIVINGVPEEIPSDITVQEFLNIKSIDPGHVVVEVNKSILKRDQLQGCQLRSGDVLEVLRFVGGG